MKYSLILSLMLLTGCATAPVAVKFPDPPGKQATISCPTLKKLNEGAKLSDVATTVTINYTTYYECLIKNDAWIEWYSINKMIFDDAAK